MRLYLNRVETACGIILPVLIFFSWPEGTSYHAIVFPLLWAWLLLGPWPLGSDAATTVATVFSPFILRCSCLSLAIVFVLACLAAGLPGNYLLWLKTIYLLALSTRFIAIAHSLAVPGRFYFIKIFWLSFWAIGALMLIVWPPPYVDLSVLPWILCLLFLWGAACALLVRLLKNPATHGLTLYIINLGPLPALTLAWADIGCWVLLGLMAFLFLLTMTQSKPVANGEQLHPAGEKRGVLWFPLWLFRSSLLLWWLSGCGLMLSLAWWLPGHNHYLDSNAWLKAFSLGLFVLICLGLLVEYSLPLLGRPEPSGRWRRDKSWGPVLSACALLAALTPVLLLPINNEPLPYYSNQVALLESPLVLSTENREVHIEAPPWLDNMKRIYITSRLLNAQHMLQAQPVAMLAVMGEVGLPSIYYLRVGIDTADQSLGQSRMLALARHTPAPYADFVLAYSPDGQAYHQQNYATGFFMQEQISNLKGLDLFYLPEPDPQAENSLLIIEQIFVE